MGSLDQRIEKELREVHEALARQGKKPTDMLIFNGKNPENLLKWTNSAQLSDILVQRISHQLEQRCRDVEPVAYSKTK